MQSLRLLNEMTEFRPYHPTSTPRKLTNMMENTSKISSTDTMSNTSKASTMTTNPMTNNMTVSGGPELVIKKIDETTKSGLLKNDPIADSMSKIMNPPAPRDVNKGQFPLSKFQAK